MSHFDYVKKVVSDCPEGREFTAKSLYGIVKHTGVGQTTVSSYLSKLKNAGLLLKTETGYVCKDCNRLRNHGTPTAITVDIPSNGAPKGTNQATLEDISADIPVGLLALKEMTESLDWLLNEHVPNLEAMNRKLNEENNSLYHFINKFTGQLSKAKEIRMATAREEDDKEAVVN